ncbi:MAG: hypothetical protein Fur0024_0590 [Patescibacteria group bacterium]
MEEKKQNLKKKSRKKTSKELSISFPTKNEQIIQSQINENFEEQKISEEQQNFLDKKFNDKFVPLKNEDDEDETPILSWEAPAFEEMEAPKWLRYGIIALFAGIEFYAAFTSSFTTFFVILSLAFLIYVYSRIAPDIVEQEICPSYIKIDGQKFFYEEIEKFWIDYDEKVQEVVFVVRGKFFRPTSHLGSLNPNFLREILINKITEVPPEPRGISDFLSRILHL